MQSPPHAGAARPSSASSRTGLRAWVVLTLVAALLVAAVIPAVGQGDADGLEIAVDLEGMWRFQTGDDEAWADPSFDDSGWEEVMVPTEGGQDVFDSYDGFAWFRLTFDLPAEAEGSNLVASLGFIDDADIAYLNGVEIGRTGVLPPDSDSQWFERRLYPVPAEAPTFGGSNVLAVRMNDFTGGGGWYRGPVGIFSKAALREAVYGIAGPLAAPAVADAVDEMLAAQAAALASGDVDAYLATLDEAYTHDGRDLDRRRRELSGWLEESDGSLTLVDAEVEVVAAADGRTIVDTNRTITGTRDGEAFAFQGPGQEFLVVDQTGTSELGNRSRFFRDHVDSEAEGMRREYVVYLPPSYYTAPEHEFPTVYLLHGINGGSREWEPRDFQQRLDALFAHPDDGGLDLAESIVIMPDGESLWYIDSSVTPWRTMFIDEMLPQVDAEYRTLPERDFRGTSGVSMGGHGAFTIGWSNPELFSSITSHMGALDFPPLVGGPDEIAANTPETPVVQAAALTPDFLDDFRYYFDACEEDDFRFDDAVRAMTGELTSKMIEHTAVVFPDGVHNDDCWLPRIDASFGLHSDSFRANGLAEPLPVTRLAGDDRIATGVALSEAAFTGAGEAVLASADVFADAVAAGPLALAVGGPLLLTGGEELDDRVLAELRRLGVDTVHLAGGDAALSPTVQQTLGDEGFAVERHGGADRFATSARIAEVVAQRLGGVGGAVLATGATFADALTALNLAAASGQPILLTPAATLAPSVEAELPELLPAGATVTVVGGPVAVGEEVAAAIEAAGFAVDRVAGDDRYATGAATARAGRTLGASGARLVLASGTTFADALTAGVAAATLDGLLVLVDPADLADSPASAELLAEIAPHHLYVAGGTAAVAEPVVAAAKTAGLGG